MSKLVKWGRSEEGYADSKCGHYQIVPLPCGTTTAQGYDLHYNNTVIAGLCDTQREAKEEAEEHAKRQGD